MLYLYLYISGCVLAFFLGLLSLISTKDNACNTNYTHCYLITVLISIGSWLVIIIYIISEIREIIIAKKDKDKK